MYFIAKTTAEKAAWEGHRLKYNHDGDCGRGLVIKWNYSRAGDSNDNDYGPGPNILGPVHWISTSIFIPTYVAVRSDNLLPSSLSLLIQVQKNFWISQFDKNDGRRWEGHRLRHGRLGIHRIMAGYEASPTRLLCSCNRTRSWYYSFTALPN